MLLALFLLHLPLVGPLGLPGWICQGAAGAACCPGGTCMPRAPSPPPSMLHVWPFNAGPLSLEAGGFWRRPWNHPRGLWGLFPGHKGWEGEAAV